MLRYILYKLYSLEEKSIKLYVVAELPKIINALAQPGEEEGTRIVGGWYFRSDVKFESEDNRFDLVLKKVLLIFPIGDRLENR